MAHAPETAPGHHALHALLLFQSARLPARFDEDGHLITLEHQDRTKWDQEMIRDGFEQLNAAQASPDLTRYHFEAGIASVHSRAETWPDTDWSSIVRLYELLSAHADSPAIKVNWAVSLIMLGELDAGERLLDEIATNGSVERFTGWHLARQKLAIARGDADAARTALSAARAGMNSDAVDAFLEQQWQLDADAP